MCKLFRCTYGEVDQYPHQVMSRSCKVMVATPGMKYHFNYRLMIYLLLWNRIRPTFIRKVMPFLLSWYKYGDAHFSLVWTTVISPCALNIIRCRFWVMVWLLGQNFLYNLQYWQYCVWVRLRAISSFLNLILTTSFHAIVIDFPHGSDNERVLYVIEKGRASYRALNPSLPGDIYHHRRRRVIVRPLEFRTSTA